MRISKLNVFFITYIFCFSTMAEEPKSAEVPSTLCSREILLTFFPKPIVIPILIQHKIDGNTADKIANELAKKDSEILVHVEEKVLQQFNRSSPVSPEDSHEDLRTKGVRIFKESLYAVFSKTLQEANVNLDDKQKMAILDEIQDTKGKLFLKCLHTQFGFPE